MHNFAFIRIKLHLPRFTLVTSVSATQSSVPRIGQMHRNLYHDPLQTPIFCIVSNWINGIYITLQTLVVWSVIDRTLQWTRLRRESIASTSIV